MANNLTGDAYRKSLAKKAIMVIGAILFLVFGKMALDGGSQTYVIIFAILSIIGLFAFLLPLIIYVFSKDKQN